MKPEPKRVSTALGSFLCTHDKPTTLLVQRTPGGEPNEGVTACSLCHAVYPEEGA